MKPETGETTATRARKPQARRSWPARFLEAFRESGNVRMACSVAGVGRATVYRKRNADPKFAARWAEAEEDALDRLEQEGIRRAVIGVSRPMVQRGEIVKDDAGNPIVVTEYSDQLLMFLMKKRGYIAPEHVGFVGADGKPADLPDSSPRDELVAKVVRIAERMEARPTQGGTDGADEGAAAG